MRAAAITMLVAAVAMLPATSLCLSATDEIPALATGVTAAVKTGAAAAAGLAASVSDLPLTVVQAAPGGSSPWFCVFLSGDGGWVDIDRGVANALAKQHMAVIGWNSLQYFWSRRTPESAAKDLDRVVRHYARAWRKQHVLLIGFSQGADTLPFMVNRLPAPTRDMVGFTALLGLSDNAAFEIHMTNWARGAADTIPTAPELKHWSGTPYLCLYGEHDADAACDQLTGEGGVAIKMAGGHHFGRHYAHIAAQILDRLPEL